MFPGLIPRLFFYFIAFLLLKILKSIVNLRSILLDFNPFLAQGLLQFFYQGEQKKINFQLRCARVPLVKSERV